MTGESAAPNVLTMYRALSMQSSSNLTSVPFSLLKLFYIFIVRTSQVLRV